MNWNKGFSASYHYCEVDPGTWKDLDRAELTGGSITISSEGLRTAADIDCTDYDRNREKWIRIWLEVKQEGDSTRLPLFTGLASAPGRDINGRAETLKLQCCSVLQPCQDILLPRGWYAPAGAAASSVIADLLSATPAPVSFFEITPMLFESIVAEEGENRLTMTEKVLKAIGWRMIILGDGTISMRPQPDTVSAVFDPEENDCIETKLAENYNWQSAPNVFRAVTSERAVIYRDEREDSILSVQNRGREIWKEEADCKLNDGESLESYAERRLYEEQGINRTVSYTRRFRPDVFVSDMVELRYPMINIDGRFAVLSQTIALGYGAPVSEEVKAV